MKQKSILWLLTLEALICLIFGALTRFLPGSGSSLLAFPYEQISTLLRLLSLSSGPGNVLAVTCYLLISASPILLLIGVRTHRELKAEDLLLPLLSIMLLRFLYLMINPGLLQDSLQRYQPDFLGLLLHSVITAYLILRVIRRFRQGDPIKLGNYMRGIILLLMGYMIFLAFGPRLSNFINSLESIQAGNTMPGLDLMPTYLMAGLGYLVSILPNLLLVWIAFLTLSLFDAMSVNAFSAEVVQVADRLSDISQLVLILIVSSSLGFNLIQLLFSDALHQIDMNLMIPLDLVFFSLVALLFARFIRETRELKEDHDLFI